MLLLLLNMRLRRLRVLGITAVHWVMLLVG
jgi:hypothetical protein